MSKLNSFYNLLSQKEKADFVAKIRLNVKFYLHN